MIKFVEAAAECWVGSGQFRQCAGVTGPQDARIGAGEEPTGAEAEAGQAVSVPAGDTFDHAVETQAAELVSHPALRQISRLLAEQGRQTFAEIFVGEAGGEQLEQQQRAAQRLHLGIGEAKSGRSLRVDLNGTIHFLKDFLGEHTVMADLFDLQ